MSANHTPAFMQPSVPAAIQAAVDADEWSALIAEQGTAQRDDVSVCPKCGDRLRFFEPKRRFECPECSYVEPAPKQ